MSCSVNEAFDLSSNVIELHPEFDLSVRESPPGAPQRIEGYSLSAPFMTSEPPHGGEMHPDGDEVLFLISGGVTVLIEDEEPPREVALEAGQAVVVPKGTWHRVRLREPSQILHLTPGPGGEHRPL